MSNVSTAPPLSAFAIMMSFCFCRLRSASRSDFFRLSRGSFSVLEDSGYLSGNLSGNQLLLLLNLGSFEFFSVVPKCALSLILR